MRKAILGLVWLLGLPGAVVTASAQDTVKIGLLMTDSVEKVEVSTRPDFFSAVDAVFRRGRGGPHRPSETQWGGF
jgi:hypothetical protein